MERANFNDKSEQRLEIGSSLKTLVKTFLNNKQNPRDFFSKDSDKILIFFASYCSYCEAEIPHLNKALDDLSLCGIQLVGVNLDDTWDQARQVGQNWQIRFPYFYDENRQLSKLLNVRRIPHFAFIDSKGVVSFNTPKISSGKEQISQKLKECKSANERGL